MFDRKDLTSKAAQRLESANLCAWFVGADLAPLVLPNGRPYPVSFEGAVTERADFSKAARG